MKLYSLISSALMASLLVACGGSDGFSGGSSSSTNQGQLTIDITDGPVENATEVVVAFTAIEVKPEEGDAFTIEFDVTQSINLLDYQGENFISLIKDHDLETGDYNWMRLLVDESETYIVVSGSQHPLDIPSSSQSGLKLNDQFTVAAGDETHITLDFELRKSIHQTGGGDYKMNPVIRMVENINANTLKGVVADNLILDTDCANDPNDEVGNAVYLFAGHDSTLQDMQGTSGDALTSAAVNYDNNEDRYEYTLGFVPHGDYTLAFTCDAINDEAFEDNSAEVDFSDSLNVTVSSDDSDSVLID